MESELGLEAGILALGGVELLAEGLDRGLSAIGRAFCAGNDFGRWGLVLRFR
jgi:hypothetical protein